MTAPRNVLFVGIDVDSMGGSQRVVHSIAHGLSQRGHRVAVLGIRPSAHPVEYFPGHTYRHDTFYPHVTRPASERTLTDKVLYQGPLKGQVNRVLRRRARVRASSWLRRTPDGYLVMGSPWAADWMVSLKWPQLRGIGWYHESFDQARTSRNLPLMQRHYPQLDRAIFLSENDARQFERAGLPNAMVMPNPVPFFPATVAPLGRPRIVAVGRLDPIKAFDRLINAFALATADPDLSGQGWELHFIGDGPERERLVEQAVAQGVADRTVFRGRCNDMAAEYLEASILALSSEREGSPMAIAEAAACGVPAVAFDISGGVRALVLDDETGLLVPPRDIEKFAAALTRLMRDPATRRRLGAQARRHVEAVSLDRIIDRWEAMFDDIDR